MQWAKLAAAEEPRGGGPSAHSGRDLLSLQWQLLPGDKPGGGGALRKKNQTGGGGRERILPSHSLLTGKSDVRSVVENKTACIAACCILSPGGAPMFGAQGMVFRETHLSKEMSVLETVQKGAK